MMAEKKCIVCGKNVRRAIAGHSHPEKYVCVDCLNELIFDVNTMEEELEPLSNALTKAIAAFKEEWEKEQQKK